MNRSFNWTVHVRETVACRLHNVDGHPFVDGCGSKVVRAYGPAICTNHTFAHHEPVSGSKCGSTALTKLAGSGQSVTHVVDQPEVFARRIRMACVVITTRLV